jgi:hypothetical protein
MARIRDLHWFLEEYRNHERGIRDKDWHYYWWIPLDRPILTACKNSPANSDYCEVYAKVALVNRMYSAQLGRGRMGKYDAEDRVSKSLCKSDIDKFVKPLLGLNVLTKAILPKVLKCHDRLVTIVHRATRKYELSFSSKYLSFHVPQVVPIFDSRAGWTARKILPDNSDFRGYGAYEKHCRRILALMDFLVKKKIKPNLKIIDYVLYSDLSA